MYRKLLIGTGAGIALTIAGLLPSVAVGASTGARADVAGSTVVLQATPTPGVHCPYLNGGTPDLGAMRAHMEAIHGPGSWDQMWGWMSAQGGAGMMRGSGMMGRPSS